MSTDAQGAEESMETDDQGAEESMDQFRASIFKLLDLVIRPYVIFYSISFSDSLKAQKQLCDAFFPFVTRFFTENLIKEECKKRSDTFSINMVDLQNVEFNHEFSLKQFRKEFIETPISFFHDNFDKRPNDTGWRPLVFYLSIANGKDPLLSRFALFGVKGNFFHCLVCNFDPAKKILKSQDSHFVPVNSVLPKKSSFMIKIIGIGSGIMVILVSFVIYRKYKS